MFYTDRKFSSLTKHPWPQSMVRKRKAIEWRRRTTNIKECGGRGQVLSGAFGEDKKGH